VSTFVVSWNEDALMNDSVESDAFVMPSSSDSARAGLPPRASRYAAGIWQFSWWDRATS
jgi:hypothetical protein